MNAERIANVKRSSGFCFSKVAISPDGSFVATASSNVGLWSVETGEQIARFRGTEGQVGNLLFAEGGKAIVCVDRYGIRFWDTESRTQQAEIPYGGAIFALGISKDEKYVAAGIGHAVHVWDATTLERVWHRVFRKQCWCLAFSPSKNILACSSGSEINICTTKPFAIKKELHGHDGDVSSLSFSDDGKILFSTSSDRSVAIWNTSRFSETGRIAEAHDISTNCVALSPDQSLLATGGSDGDVKLWDWKSRELIRTLPVGDPSKPRKRMSVVISAAFSPDSTTLVFGGAKPNHLQFWRLG